MNGGYFMNAGILYGIAQAAYQRTASAPSDAVGGQNDALVAVLFSAATLEAVIMEVATFAEGDATHYGSRKMRSVSAVLDEAESSRGSIRLKYQMVRVLLTGESFDKGAQPYQDFETLFAIRDAIVHLKPEKATETPHRLVQRLYAKGCCEASEASVVASWIGQISTRATARWACSLVTTMVRELLSWLPSDEPTPFVWTLLALRFGMANPTDPPETS